MAEETLHVVVRAVDGGFYATSPQAPGLAYGRETLAELRAGLEDVLAFHLGRPGPFRTIEHREEVHEIGADELVVRLALDGHLRERELVSARLGRAMLVPAQAEVLAAGPRDLVGEVRYVCAVPSDTLGWLGSQLGPTDTASAVVAIGDELLLTFAVPDASTVDPSLTVADLMHDRPILRPATVPLAG